MTLPLILLAALALRLTNLDWDSGHLFHPDERHILMVTEGLRVPVPFDLGVLLRPESPLNPKSFAYGSLVFYLLKVFHTVAQALGGALGFSGSDWMLPGLGGLRFTGRTLSALFDTGTVFLTYQLARVLYGRREAILAATFVAFSVLHIQLSHFYASDTPMTFFALLALLFSAHFVRWGQARSAVWAGIASGLALACKVSAAPILAAVGIAHLLRVILPSEEAITQGAAREYQSPSPVRLVRIGIAFGIVLIIAVVTMIVFEPYAVIDSTRFFQNVAEQNAMVRGSADLPYTRQYIDRPAYWYFIQNLALFGVGLPLAIAMLAGWIYVAWRAIREPGRADLLLLAFVVPYFAITGAFHAKFIRYLLPITPVLAIFAAVGLVRLRSWAATLVPQPPVEPLVLEPVAALPVAPVLEVDEETRRWAELKGLSLFEDVVPDAPTDLSVEEPTVPERNGWQTHLAAIASALVVAATGLYAVAYQNVYRGEHPAVVASRWIYENVPPRSTLANEHWEEGIPVSVRTATRQLDPGQLQYQRAELPMYEQDDERKLRQLATALTRADYILFFSNRLYGTVPRLSDRYPMSTRYYQLLFGEELGFRLVGAFSKYPEFLGVALVDETLADPRLPTPELLRTQRPAPVTINLGRADEAFSVYDHPRVLVFKKERPVTEAEVRAQLAPALPAAPPAAARPGAQTQPIYRSLLLAADQSLRQRLGGTYSELFDRGSLANQVPFVVWSMLLLLVGALAAPLAVAALPRLGDGGLPLARPLGLLLMTWITWMLVAVAGLPATRAVSIVGLVLLGALGLAFARGRLGSLATLWRERRAALVTGEALFWIPFVYFVLVRMANPDLWHPARGGEKPMDLAYLMAAIKSTAYPPYDPWFAGGFLNYYYFGQIIAGNLVKLTGVVPTTAYNLIVPTLYAMTFAGAYSVAYTLARRLPGASERAAIVGGAAAGFFVTTMGNLGGAIQFGEGLVRLSGTSYQSLIPGAQYLVLGILGFVQWILGRQFQIGTDWYWTSTRVIEGTINEFPYFTFLYADLHAHMIGLPFTLLAMALAVSMALSTPPRLSLAPFSRRLGFALPVALPRTLPTMPGASDLARVAAGVQPDGVLRVVAAGLAVGALLPINSWDFPTYLGLVSVAALVPWYLGARRDLQVLAASVARAFTIAALSYLLYLPFHRTFVQFYTGVRPTPEQSNVIGYLIIHGFFLAVLGSFVALDAGRALRRNATWRTIAAWWRWWDRGGHFLALRRRLVRRDDGGGTVAAAAVIGMLGLILVAAYLGYTLAGLLIAVLALTLWRMLAGPRTPESALVLLLFATGLALSAAVEIVALEGDVGRMNTVFKFYLQIWVMWGVASGVAIVALRHRISSGLSGAGARRWWATSMAILLLFGCFYPLIATKARVADRFDTTIPPTLDGTAYMRNAVYNDERRELRLGRDLKAFEWMWQNVRGSPVVAEGHAPLYRWGSRVSIYTGLPTIIGWDWHQTQQRWGFRQMIEERTRDVRALYSEPSRERALQILQRYDVSYVYVGEMERAYYPAAGLAKFDEMVGRELALVYDQDGVKIYAVAGAL